MYVHYYSRYCVLPVRTVGLWRVHCMLWNRREHFLWWWWLATHRRCLLEGGVSELMTKSTHLVYRPVSLLPHNHPLITSKQEVRATVAILTCWLCCKRWQRDGRIVVVRMKKRLTTTRTRRRRSNLHPPIIRMAARPERAWICTWKCLGPIAEVPCGGPIRLRMKRTVKLLPWLYKYVQYNAIQYSIV
jgi:hypothetical protein